LSISENFCFSKILQRLVFRLSLEKPLHKRNLNSFQTKKHFGRGKQNCKKEFANSFQEKIIELESSKTRIKQFLLKYQ